jgi:hypothetical protein
MCTRRLDRMRDQALALVRVARQKFGRIHRDWEREVAAAGSCCPRSAVAGGTPATMTDGIAWR